MKLLAASATAVAGTALAFVVAYWAWQILAPAPLHIAAPPPSDPVAAIITADLFHRSGPAAPANEPAPATLPGDARLLGIIAAPRERGYALFQFADGAKLVAQGQPIMQGIVLESVEPFAVTIRDGKGAHRFALPEHMTSSANTPTASTRTGKPAPVVATPTRASAATCAPPAGFKGNVVRINAELLAGWSGDAGPWRTLLAPADGGLVVRSNGGFAAMLGLKAGDRLAQANGIALRVPDDVGAGVIRPLLANQGVRVVGSRSGATHELWIANVACAG